MIVTGKPGPTIREQAERFRTALQNQNSEWANSQEPKSSTRGDMVTDFFWKSNSEGDELSGNFTRTADGLKRYDVSFADRTENGIEHAEYAMRTSKPTTKAAGVGEWIKWKGFALAIGVPMLHHVGSALMTAGDWLTYDKSAPDVQIFKERTDEGSKFAVYGSDGQYLGNQVLDSQKTLFS